jgi:hypothetical protein
MRAASTVNDSILVSHLTSLRRAGITWPSPGDRVRYLDGFRVIRAFDVAGAYEMLLDQRLSMIRVRNRCIAQLAEVLRNASS